MDIAEYRLMKEYQGAEVRVPTAISGTLLYTQAWLQFEPWKETKDMLPPSRQWPPPNWPPADIPPLLLNTSQVNFKDARMRLLCFDRARATVSIVNRDALQGLARGVVAVQRMDLCFTTLISCSGLLDDILLPAIVNSITSFGRHTTNVVEQLWINHSNFLTEVQRFWVCNWALLSQSSAARMAAIPNLSTTRQMWDYCDGRVYFSPAEAIYEAPFLPALAWAWFL